MPLNADRKFKQVPGRSIKNNYGQSQISQLPKIKEKHIENWFTVAWL
jgi:hypothetical protein